MQRTLWFADAILVASVVSACSAPRDASANIVDSTGGRAVDDNGARPVAFIADLENPESVRYVEDMNAVEREIGRVAKNDARTAKTASRLTVPPIDVRTF